MPTRSKDSTRKDEGVRCLFRGYLRYATVFGVVIVESGDDVPPRRVFRYAGTYCSCAALEWINICLSFFARASNCVGIAY